MSSNQVADFMAGFHLAIRAVRFNELATPAWKSGFRSGTRALEEAAKELAKLLGEESPQESRAAELQLDVSAEEARALHRVVRAMHDGHCPSCGYLDDAAKFVVDRETEAERHSCPRCLFHIFRHEAELALAEFRPYLGRSVAIFDAWRTKVMNAKADGSE